MLDDVKYLELLDARGTMLLKIEMNEFKSLILERDTVMMILITPAGLPASTTLDEHNNMQKGDVIILVHQLPDNPDQIEVLPAKVVHSKYYKGLLV